MRAPFSAADDGDGGIRGRGEGGESKLRGRVGLLLTLALVTLLSLAQKIAPPTTGGSDGAVSGDDGRSIASLRATTSHNGTSPSWAHAGRDADTRTAANDRRQRPYAASNGIAPSSPASRLGSNTTAKAIEQSADASRANEQSEAGARENDPIQRLSASSLPIYLLDSSANRTAVTTWGRVARGWNRTTQYEDLLDEATQVPSLPLPTPDDTRRTVVMIHCGPKTGSTTLRTACRKNLENTCGVERAKSNRHYPLGYMDEGELYPLIRRCEDTSHFCAKEIGMPYEVPTFYNVRFVHMFPFRNYDEWAASALKQAYDRGGDSGCDRARSKLEVCEPSRMEIDLRKYGKAELSRFKEGAVRRMNDYGERHAFLLYHHRELNDLLGKLSEVYGIPLLPGSDGRGKETRPEGTCDGELLRMFHDCFSSELMELT